MGCFQELYEPAPYVSEPVGYRGWLILLNVVLLCCVGLLWSMKRYLSKSDGFLCLDKIKYLCEIKPYRLCLSEFWG